MRSGSEVRSSRCIIHPSAIVHPDAVLGDDVEVGPFTTIEGTVKIGARTKVGPRVSIEGHTTIGEDNEIFAGAIVGSPTQDKKDDGGVSYLRIGDRNKIREYVTMNPGTKDGTETVIGDDNLMMAYAHVAHDCILKNHVVLANAATLAGHVVVEDRAIIGGLSAVHQFVHIGQFALIGGCSKVVQDVPPYVIADGHPARAYGINTVGLERAGYSKQDKTDIKKAFKFIFKSKLKLQDAIQKIQSEFPNSAALQVSAEFLKQAAERGICR